MKLPTIKDLNRGKWDNHYSFSIKGLGSFEFNYDSTEPLTDVDGVNYETVVRMGDCAFKEITFYFDDTDIEPIIDNQIKDSKIFETLIQKFSEYNVIHESEYNFIYNF